MMKQFQRGCAAIVLIAATAMSALPAKAQQKSEISLSRQPGIFYMPSHIMEKQKLIEKHAALLGVPGVTTKWITFSGGGAQTDALLAGGVDILNTGTGNLLLLWDRTRGAPCRARSSRAAARGAGWADSMAAAPADLPLMH